MRAACVWQARFLRTNLPHLSLSRNDTALFAILSTQRATEAWTLYASTPRTSVTVLSQPPTSMEE